LHRNNLASSLLVVILVKRSAEWKLFTPRFHPFMLCKGL
jgi:hypothetical protein